MTMQWLMRSLFADGVSSGKVVGLFSTVGLAAVQHAKEGRMDTVHDLVINVGHYFRANDIGYFIQGQPKKKKDTNNRNTYVASAIFTGAIIVVLWYSFGRK